MNKVARNIFQNGYNKPKQKSQKVTANSIIDIFKKKKLSNVPLNKCSIEIYWRSGFQESLVFRYILTDRLRHQNEKIFK